MVSLYIKKGLSRNDSIKLVNLLSKNKNILINTIMREELNLPGGRSSPFRNSLFTFFSFVIFGFIPLIAFILQLFYNIQNVFIISIVLTAIALFVLGGAKYKITGKGWFKSGIETLIIGGLAASGAYFVGRFVSTFV